MKKYFLQIIISIISIITITAQESPETAPIKTFQLGEVVITDSVDNNSFTEMKFEDIKDYNKLSVPAALDILSGVSLSFVGARNEGMIYVRGYDLRQVPVFIDGMPVYVPYDGYIDIARLQTFNASKISVSKGFSSMLYGANSMGGTINIISSKPSADLELYGSTGSTTSSKEINGYNSNIIAGSRFDKFYVQVNYSITDKDYATLPSSFNTTTSEKEYKRDNSFTKDIQYQVKVGCEPDVGSEYAVSYSAVRSKKGVPIYLGSNSSTKVRYWQYPDWDKDCYYFHSKSDLGENLILKTRLFYDKYYNVLKSFDNNTYTTQSSKSAFISIYDDNSLGGSAELGVYSTPKNVLKFVINTKIDHHQEHNVGETPRNFKDNTMTYAAENILQLSPQLSVLAGVGYYTRIGIKAEDYDSSKDSVYNFPTSNDKSFNYQVGLFYRLMQSQSVYLTIARKSRFATMKDRYSYRFGTAIPNPWLHSENSLNTEIGYSGRINYIQWSASLFYNFIDNTIQRVDNVEPGIYQLQNTGKAEFRGIEYNIRWQFYSMFSIGSSYSFIEQKNISNPDVKFVDVPKNKVTGFLKAEIPGVFFAMFDVEYNSKRFSTSDGLYTAAAYTIFNLNAEYNIIKFLSIRAGVNNLFDKLYYITEGYPEEGRTINFSLIYRFSN
jgi:iron complex outermembrane recepter protein